MSRSPPISTLFPYTTLFRSVLRQMVCGVNRPGPKEAQMSGIPHPHRSEEHTSELQSHLNLVCRLLLEKKKSPTCTTRSAQGSPPRLAAARRLLRRRDARPDA